MPSDAVEGLRQTDQLEQFRTVLDTLGEPHPAFELGFRWLEANRPATTTVGVVHGDFRLRNILVDQDGLRAAPVWPLTHLSDPPEDLWRFSIPAWRLGSTLPAGGVATRWERVLDYDAASGPVVDMAALRRWEPH